MVSLVLQETGDAPESAQLAYPWGLAVDAGGNLYIADSVNHRIRKVENRPEGTRGSGALRYDFSGDGSVDILWRDTAGNVSMWLMERIHDRRQSASSPISGLAGPLWEVGDFNGDGKADILWRDGAGKCGDLADGRDNDCKLQRYSQSMRKEWAVAGVGDFNGDGKTDIVWRDAAGDVADLDRWTD